MPALTYTVSDFTPFTKIRSADVNTRFQDIRTLLNTTGLDDTNLQVHGLTRNGSSSRLKVGTANYVLINDANGDLSEEATLATSRGGLGLAYTPSSADAGKVLSVNAAGSAFAVQTVPNPPAMNVFNFYRYG